MGCGTNHFATPWMTGWSMRFSISFHIGTPRGVRIDLAFGMQGIGPQRLGLRRNSVRAHADGLEELDQGVRAERRTASGRRTQTRKSSRSRSARQQNQAGHCRVAFGAQRRQPGFIPSSYRLCLSGEESIARGAHSAAMASQTLGAKSTKVGAISRKSFIIVSGSSTKFVIFIRHNTLGRSHKPAP